MTALTDNIRTIVDDLKSSWYFRIYAITWFICFIFGCIAFFSFVKGISANGTSFVVNSNIPDAAHGGPPSGTDSIGTWISNETSISFPDFEFFFQGDDANLFDNVVCQTGAYNQGEAPPAGGLFDVTVGPCDGMDINKCVTVLGSEFEAEYPYTVGSKAYQIDCYINATTATMADLVGFQITNATTIGVNAAQPEWLFPDSGIWVLLQANEYMSSSGEVYNSWQQDKVYKSAHSSYGRWVVTVAIPANIVIHYFSYGAASQSFSTNGFSISGFVTFGAFAGFIGFLYIVHKAFMFVVGIFLENNSRFLNANGEKSYNSINN